MHPKHKSAGKDHFKILAFAFVILLGSLLTACAGPLQVRYNPKPEASAKVQSPVTVFIEPVKDARGADNARVIGKISAIVADMNPGDLALSEDVKTLVERAIASEFASAGYSVKTTGDAKEADFILSAEVKEFRLNIESRDEISISIPVKLTETATNRPLWEGGAVEKSDKFAGVTGNSRQSISNYISVSLSKAIRTVVSEVNAKVSNTKAAYVPAQAEDKATGYEKSAPVGTGRIVVATEPSRSKVYVGDVYYGLTPLSLDLDPGVYELVIKQKGYKETKEKVSVRQGQFTEMEVSMEKE